MRNRGIGIKLCGLALAILSLALLAAPLSAHHGTADYDTGKQVTLKGTITLFEWSYPHSQVHLDVVDDQGNVAALEL